MLREAALLRALPAAGRVLLQPADLRPAGPGLQRPVPPSLQGESSWAPLRGGRVQAVLKEGKHVLVSWGS